MVFINFDIVILVDDTLNGKNNQNGTEKRGEDKSI